MRPVRELGLGLVTVGVVMLLFVGYELAGTNLSERHSQAQLARDFKAELAQAQAGGQPKPPAVPTSAVPTSTVPTSAVPTSPKPAKTGSAVPRPTVYLPPAGGALDHLVIPAINLDRYVVQGVDENDLQQGPGHYPGTPLPGQAGNVGIAGHRTTYGAPFFRLNELRPGDRIYLTDTSGTTWVYRVLYQQVVPPTDVSVLTPTRNAMLTLTTCNPRFDATSRLIIRAVLAIKIAPSTSTGRPGKQSVPSRPAVPAAAPRPVHNGTVLAGTTSSTGSSQARDTPTVASPAGTATASAGRPGGWAGTAGWGALTLGCWVATRLGAARRRRWGKIGVLALGTLICLVPLWYAFVGAARLLPANI